MNLNRRAPVDTRSHGFPSRRRRRRSRLALTGGVALCGLTLAACSSSHTASSATTTGSGDQTSYAASHFTTKLSGYCPSTLYVQTNWLPEPDHGALYELIGAAGTMHQYAYEGPLGSTGIKLDILSGGPGDANLPIPATMYTGNPVARVTPQLGMDSPDTAIQDSKQFPVVGVATLQEHDPLVLIYDPQKWHDLDSVSAFVNAAKHGARFYVTSLQTPYVPWLIAKGVPSSAFISGYSGDLDKFVTSDGDIINQGYSDSEVINLEHFTTAWDKPVDYTYVYKLGLNDYDEAIEVAKDKLATLTPCLKRLVPMIQQAEVDYLEHPAVVNEVLAKFNSGGYGASYWQTSLAYSEDADQILKNQDIVGNSVGGSGAIGAFEMSRLQQNVDTLVPIYKKQGASVAAGLTASSIATNEFIDPSIKLPSGQ